MKVMQINSVCTVGSTGRIVAGISDILNKSGIDNRMIYTYGKSDLENSIKCGNEKYIKFQALLSRITGLYGFLSYFQTKKIIKEIEKFSPDIVHIHNIHGHDCNVLTLFNYLKKKHIKTVLTFHDCWLFTGYCTYFTAEGCDKWEKGCKDCPQYKKYSFFFDKSRKLQNKKIQAFCGLDATIVTPSKWLGDLVKKSKLSIFPVKVINNGIDLSVFLPTESNFRDKYNIKDKFVLLGVSTEWGHRKGLDTFIRLAGELGDEFKIVLVGTNDKVDKDLPSNIISIHRTDSPKELAEIYTAADLFVNPTREDNFCTVNIESLASGTPVLTYHSGGSPEIISESTGVSVKCDDYEAFKGTILKIKDEKPFKREDCILRGKEFDMHEKFSEYVKLYREILKKRDSK